MQIALSVTTLDARLARSMEAAAGAGAVDTGCVLLAASLQGVAPLFRDWLLREYPDRYRRVISLVRSMWSGRDYNAEWRTRMRGAGLVSGLLPGASDWFAGIWVWGAAIPG